MGTRKNFSENYRQFGHALSKRFAIPGLELSTIGAPREVARSGVTGREDTIFGISPTVSVTVFIIHYLHAQTRNPWVAVSGFVYVRQELVFSSSIVRVRSHPPVPLTYAPRQLVPLP
jgi:hypothetical protein